MKVLFVSDIHIGAPDDPRARLFTAWLDRVLADPPTHLFLVGDIFDLWIADRRYFIERYAAVIARLRRLRAAGCELHYFEGNHDLDLEVFWARDVGARVYDRPTLFELDGRRVLVEHGDQMDPSDRGYRFLRWLLRTPVVRALGRWLPNRVVRAIGERASRTSRHYTTEVRPSSEGRAREVIRAHVSRLLQAQNFDVFVAGHVHVIEDTVVGQARVFNLGTWLKEPRVLQMLGGVTTLLPISD